MWFGATSENTTGRPAGADATHRLSVFEASVLSLSISRLFCLSWGAPKRGEARGEAAVWGGPGKRVDARRGDRAVTRTAHKKGFVQEGQTVVFFWIGGFVAWVDLEGGLLFSQQFFWPPSPGQAESLIAHERAQSDETFGGGPGAALWSPAAVVVGSEAEQPTSMVRVKTCFPHSILRPTRSRRRPVLSNCWAIGRLNQPSRTQETHQEIAEAERQRPRVQALLCGPSRVRPLDLGPRTALYGPQIEKMSITVI